MLNINIITLNIIIATKKATGITFICKKNVNNEQSKNSTKDFACKLFLYFAKVKSDEKDSESNIKDEKKFNILK